MLVSLFPLRSSFDNIESVLLSHSNTPSRCIGTEN
uniref:Uncharacterized protein n=1 Tax=Anguilla anguilla TaxID=7936 RepID=A0A0E9PT15_ANGAN